MRGVSILAALAMLGGCSLMYAPADPDESAAGEPDPFEPLELEREPLRCPIDFVPPAVLFSFTGFTVPTANPGEPPVYEGFGTFDGADDLSHLVAIIAAQDVDTERDLLALDEVLVILGARWNSETEESAVDYLATAGSVHFADLCDTGMSGVMTDIHLVEFDPTTEEPLDIGCEADLPTTNFTFGDCP